MNPKAWAAAFKTFVAAFILLQQTIKKDLPSSLLTVLLLGLAYTGSQVVAEDWDLKAGLQRAFLQSDSDKAESGKVRSAEALQQELRMTERSNRQIQARLRWIMASVPTASRTRVAVIHNGAYSLTGAALLRFDITHGEAKAGRTVGDFVTNAPLSQWADYLDHLIRDECVLVQLSEMKDPAAIDQLRRLNISKFLVCPIANANRQILGGLFTSWDIGDGAPDDMEAVIKLHREAAALIGVSLELRPEPVN